MCVAVNCQMQLSPDTTALFAVLSDFPFAFTKDLQPGGINHQVCDFTPGGRFETDINRLCPLTDTGVIRAAQRNVHQGKNGINVKPCAARRVSRTTAFNHQNGGDGEIRIALGPSS